MTVKQGITFVSPDFNFITKKKKKINKIMTKDDTDDTFMRKKKEKTVRIGNKTSKKFIFLRAEVATYVCSSTVRKYSNNTVKLNSDSYTIWVGNNAFKAISNMISHIISALTPTPNTVLRGEGCNLKVKGKGIIKWKLRRMMAKYILSSSKTAYTSQAYLPVY